MTIILYYFIDQSLRNVLRYHYTILEIKKRRVLLNVKTIKGPMIVGIFM